VKKNPEKTSPNPRKKTSSRGKKTASPPAGRKRTRKRRPAGRDIFRAVILTAVLIALAAFISTALIVLRSAPRSVSAPADAVSERDTVPERNAVPERNTVPGRGSVPEGTGRTIPSESPARPPERPEYRGTIAFVIDDAGNNLGELEPFLRFPGPLTIAVLPGLPHSAEAARRIRAAGKELFLHQPMEAVGGQNPGPGAVYLDMDGDTIRSVIKTNLAEIGPVAGMNNHQGSGVTMDRGAMETILALCREEGIYFLDSRTIAGTAAPETARALGMTIGERDVFIDNIRERSSMLKYIEEGLAKAEQKGYAVMIGHAWSPELAGILTELYPDFLARGYSLSTMSALIHSGGRRIP
jgi:polysaccharide deacetylase 2 family uncharacterized protein YibQ